MKVKEGVFNLKHFFEIELWRTKISTLPPFKRFLFGQLRIWIIALSEFKKDRIIEKASALTYFTLLSIVPVVAMAFGISKGFGLDEYLVEQLESIFSAQEAILEQVLVFAKTMLDNAHGGVISGFSFVFLVYAVIRLMNSIEIAFNEIWDTKSRNWQRKISDYIAIILIGPIFIILSNSATVFVTDLIRQMTETNAIFSFLRPIIYNLLRLLPYFIICLLLMILYLIFPNTRVKFWPAVIAALLAGIAFQATQWAWINGQVYLSRYNAIYGTFAALPLFMIYLQISWLIILFGAEYAYATQNAISWEYRHSRMRMSLDHRRKLMLLILHYIIKNFEEAKPPLTISELSTLVQVPYRFIKNICRELEESGIIHKILDEDQDRYLPSMDIQQIDIYTVFQKVDATGFSELKRDQDENFERVEALLEAIQMDVKQSRANILVKDLFTSRLK